MDDLKTALSRSKEESEKIEEAHSSSNLDVCSPKMYELRRLESEPWSFGVNGSFIPTVQGKHKDYFLAMQVAMPLSRIVGPYALMMSVSVRTFPLCPSKFKFLHGSSLALARIVQEDDPFMVACDRGDLIAVRTMLQKGQGRPTDVIDRNWTPLAVSIAFLDHRCSLIY